MNEGADGYDGPFTVEHSEAAMTNCGCDHPYIGAQAINEPTRCERCRGLVDDVAQARLDAIYAESRIRLEEWAKAYPFGPQTVRRRNNE